MTDKLSAGRILVEVAVLGAVAVAAARLLTPGPAPLPTTAWHWQQASRPAVAVPPAPATAAAPTDVRQPTVAGAFYPADPAELNRAIDACMGQVALVGLRRTRAILVPHAGYRFSGTVAATSFKQVDSRFNRVFILAANHSAEARFTGVSLPRATHYAVPGATIAVDPLLATLRDDPLFTHVPAAHSTHIIEVELPFLQYLKGYPRVPAYTIAPMIAGNLSREQATRLAELLAGHDDGRTLFVFSVDLSHYYPDETARKLDSHAIEALLSRDLERLGNARTDGNHVLQTMVMLADARGWQPSFITYRNSGDAGGGKDRVVGYAALAFHEPLQLDADEQAMMLRLARQAVETYVRDGQTVNVTEQLLSRYPILRLRRGVFVTLTKNGELRGCIGQTFGVTPLATGIINFAISAASRDGRFQPVTSDELPALGYSVSILDFPERLQVRSPEEYPSALRPGTDGVILMYEGRQSTYLPQVWEMIPEPEDFLSRLCLKQGSPANAWQQPGTRIYRYAALAFGEK